MDTDFEITDITQVGFWLLVDDKKYYVPFVEHPTFNKAAVEQIYKVKSSSTT